MTTSRDLRSLGHMIAATPAPTGDATVRQGVVQAVDLDARTVDVTVAGSSVTIPDVTYLTGWPQVGDVAWLLRFGTDVLAFLPQPTPDYLWVPAAAFAQQAGSPVAKSMGRAQVWALPTGSLSSVSSSVIFPRGWTSYDVRVWGTHAVAGSGDVLLGYRSTEMAAGATTQTDKASSDLAVTVGSLNTFRAQLHSTGLAVDPLERSVVRISRLGNDGADTFGQEWGLVAVELIRSG